MEGCHLRYQVPPGDLAGQDVLPAYWLLGGHPRPLGLALVTLRGGGAALEEIKGEPLLVEVKG